MTRSPKFVPLILFPLLLALPSSAGAGVDLTVHDIGLSLGNSPRVIGIRLNAVDSDVRRIDGLNFTLWNPRPSPQADFNGLAIGIIGPKAGRLLGIAVGGIGVTATDRIRGFALGGFGAGAQHLDGIAVGGLLTEVKSRSRGLLLSGIACRARGQLNGFAIGGGWVQTDNARGAAIGGLAAIGRTMDGLAVSAGVTAFDGRVRGLCLGGLAAGGQHLSGIGLSGGGVFTNGDIHGLAIGGVSAIAGGTLRGIALSAGLAGAGKDMNGIAVGGLGVGAAEHMRGVAIGGFVALAPEVTGISFGALNGVVVKSINLEDFLEIKTVNKRHTGISLGLINYSAELRGVQIGLFNYAANNPKWARLLPGINVHF